MVILDADSVMSGECLTGLARGETLFFKPKVWQKA